MFKQVTRKQLEKLRELQNERDQYAHALGVATAEFEDAKKTFFQALNRSKKCQMKMGEQFLKANGVDPETGDYRIIIFNGVPLIDPGMSEGTIQKLVSGEWINVEVED